VFYQILLIQPDETLWRANSRNCRSCVLPASPTPPT